MTARSSFALLAGLSALGACGPPAGAARGAAVPLVVPRAVAPGPAAAPVARASAAPAEARRCALPSPAALPPEPAPNASGRCRPPEVWARGEVRSRLVRSFQREYTTGSRVEVWFGCDRLGDEIDEIVFERGNGHGGSLELWRLRRAAGRPVYELLGLSAKGHYGPGNEPPLVRRGAVDAAAVAASLPVLRASLLALPREALPRGQNPWALGRTFSFSTNDFHTSVELRDAAGAVLERSFTGYPSSQGQEEHRPMAIADEALSALVDGAHAEPAPVDDDARAFFARQFVRAGASGPYWWVGERLAKLAATFGSGATAGPLLAMARASSAGDAAVERTRGHALDALAALSGWDARRDGAGARVDDASAAEAYAAACAPGGVGPWGR